MPAETTLCPHCRQNVPTKPFCDLCGKPLSRNIGLVDDGTELIAEVTSPRSIDGTGGGAESKPQMMCPVCQRTVAWGQFCDNCGTDLSSGSLAASGMSRMGGTILLPSGAPDPTGHPFYAVGSVPRLHVQPSNSIIPIPVRKERCLIGRDDPQRNIIPDINLESYGAGPAGVSRRHAWLIRDGQSWYLEHISESSTTHIMDDRLEVGVPFPLNDRDLVRLGRLSLIFRV